MLYGDATKSCCGKKSSLKDTEDFGKQSSVFSFTALSHGKREALEIVICLLLLSLLLFSEVKPLE